MEPNTPENNRPQPSGGNKSSSTNNRQRRPRQAISEAEMNSDIEAIVSSLRKNPARLKPVLSLATGRAGSRQIIVQTGECQSLSRALQDLDRVMLYASSRSLFADPETIHALSNAHLMVSEAANKILDSISSLAKASNFDISTLNAPDVRRILLDREKEAKKLAQSKQPVTSPSGTGTTS